jgi:hypothetical protein
VLGLEVTQVMAVSFSTCTDSQAHCSGQDAGRVLEGVNWWASLGDTATGRAKSKKQCMHGHK